MNRRVGFHFAAVYFIISFKFKAKIMDLSSPSIQQDPKEVTEKMLHMLFGMSDQNQNEALEYCISRIRQDRQSRIAEFETHVKEIYASLESLPRIETQIEGKHG